MFESRVDLCVTAMETGSLRGTYKYLFHFSPCRREDVERLAVEADPGATALNTQHSRGKYTFLCQLLL